jgi:hypothetical protein
MMMALLCPWDYAVCHQTFQVGKPDDSGSYYIPVDMRLLTSRQQYISQPTVMLYAIQNEFKT